MKPQGDRLAVSFLNMSEILFFLSKSYRFFCHILI